VIDCIKYLIQEQFLVTNYKKQIIQEISFSKKEKIVDLNKKLYLVTHYCKTHYVKR
jgi:hypothetical protein